MPPAALARSARHRDAVAEPDRAAAAGGGGRPLVLEDGLVDVLGRVSSRQAVAALRFTLVVSLLVTAINAVMGTLIAWVLVRDEFRGKRVVNALIDLPFALPTIVAGIVLLALYGEAIALHEGGGAGRAAVRDAAVRRAGGPAGAARTRSGHGGGRLVARARVR